MAFSDRSFLHVAALCFFSMFVSCLVIFGLYHAWPQVTNYAFLASGQLVSRPVWSFVGGHLRSVTLEDSPFEPQLVGVSRALAAAFFFLSSFSTVEEFFFQKK